MTPEEKRKNHAEATLRYYYKNKQKCIDASIKWRKENSEKVNESAKKYRENNPEKIKEKNKSCKSKTLCDWKHRGLIHDNIEELYEKYINTWECENCGIELVTGPRVSNSKCMDHCHKSKKFRNILCHNCNIQRGLDDRSNK